MNKLLISAAILGLTATAQIGQAQAFGDGDHKCFGIAKAGSNDCAHAFGAHTCAGRAVSSNDKGDWIYIADENKCLTKCGSFNKPGEPDPKLCANAGPAADAGMNTMPIALPNPGTIVAAPAVLPNVGVLNNPNAGKPEPVTSFVSDRE